MDFDANAVNGILGNRRSELVKPTFTLDFFQSTLDALGWKRSVAGNENFNKVTVTTYEALSRRRMGVLLAGNAGCGKTAFLKVLTKCRKSRIVSNPLLWVNLGIVGEEEKLTPEYARLYNFDPMKCLVVLDDLGAEYQQSEYGVSKNPVADFITKYQLYGEYRMLVTTNCTSETLRRKYGDPIISRLCEMCYCVKLTDSGDHRMDSGAAKG